MKMVTDVDEILKSAGPRVSVYYLFDEQLLFWTLIALNPHRPSSVSSLSF